MDSLDVNVIDRSTNESAVRHSIWFRRAKGVCARSWVGRCLSTRVCHYNVELANFFRRPQSFTGVLKQGSIFMHVKTGVKQNVSLRDARQQDNGMRHAKTMSNCRILSLTAIICMFLAHGEENERILFELALRELKLLICHPHLPDSPHGV